MERILVAEPDYGVGNLLCDVLQEEGYKVLLSQSLEEANRLLSKYHFDLLITEAYRQADPYRFDPTFLSDLTPTHSNSNMPIILCSKYPFIDDLRPGDCNLVDVLPQPFTVDDLLRKVKCLIIHY